MTTKLHINISEGVIDIEGDPALVREIYADFKDQLITAKLFATPTPPRALEFSQSEGSGSNVGSGSSLKQKPRRRPASKKVVQEDSGSGVFADAPKLDKNLDTANLAAFYGRFLPKNNTDKIVIFLKFMTDELDIKSPNTDQVYTCFKRVGEKIPKAFAQAFYDTSSKHGFIEYRSATDFPITIAGENHFSHTLKRKTAE